MTEQLTYKLFRRATCLQLIVPFLQLVVQFLPLSFQNNLFESKLNAQIQPFLGIFCNLSTLAFFSQETPVSMKTFSYWQNDLKSKLSYLFAVLLLRYVSNHKNNN